MINNFMEKLISIKIRKKNMMRYQKTQSLDEKIEHISLNSIPYLKIKDIIKWNLSLAYFIVLSFLLLKVIFI